MTIKLFGLGHSRSFRCLWALEEAGLDYEFVSLQLGSTDADGAYNDDYIALNPQGKVPTLIHDDFVLTESAAIINYIDSLVDNSFIPERGKDRARYDELSYFVLTELEQPLWTTGKHRFAIPEEHRVPDVLNTARWEFDKALSALGILTELDHYAIGDTFTFADILMAHTMNWADRFKFDLSAEHLAYRDRMYARDAAQQALTMFEP